MITEMILGTVSSIFLFALHIDSKTIFPKPLSKAEEEECFRKMKEGDTEARTKLIEHNLRLVAHMIKKYCVGAKDQDELISIGTVGLIKAVSTFDIDKGSRFATYASRCIENEVLMHFRSMKKTQGNVYIDDPIETDKDGNALTLLDIIGDDTDVAEQAELSIRTSQLYGFLDKALDEREMSIIKHRYGLYGCQPLTQREVAKKLGISRSYVARIEKKALTALKKMYDNNPY